ncbi:MAG: hypothetical protein ACO1OT_17070 [Heyndrickxia sp.]
MNYYHHAPNAYQHRQFPFLFGAPLLGGFVGGLIGSALLRPRPPFYGGYPYGVGGYPYPPYGGYGPYY